jgi:hypothetical protein
MQGLSGNLAGGCIRSRLLQAPPAGHAGTVALPTVSILHDARPNMRIRQLYVVCVLPAVDMMKLGSEPSHYPLPLTNF